MKTTDYVCGTIYLGAIFLITAIGYNYAPLRSWADNQSHSTIEANKTFERVYNDVPVDNIKAQEWLQDNVPEQVLTFNQEPRTYENENRETGDDRAKELLDRYGLGYTFDYWKDQGDKHGIVYSLPLCIGIAESGLGNNLTTKNNIGNVGNNDRGDRKEMQDIEQGIRAIFQTIDGTYLGRYSMIGELSGQGRKDMGLPGCAEQGVFCYASDTKHWNDNVSKCMTKIWGREIGASFNYKY